MRCEKCGIHLPGSPRYCPLCQGELSGKPRPGENTFPVIPLRKLPNRTLLAWMAFVTVAAIAICVAINLSLPFGGWWSLFVVAGLGSLWLSFAFVVKKRKNIPKGILWQVAVISLIAFFWDRFTGFHCWSLDFVFPILCTCAMIAMAAVAKVMKLRIQDYILYLVIDCVLGILSFILLVLGKIRVVYPAAICFASTIIFLAALLFFEGKALWAELQRRLHL